MEVVLTKVYSNQSKTIRLDDLTAGSCRKDLMFVALPHYCFPNMKTLEVMGNWC